MLKKSIGILMEVKKYLDLDAQKNATRLSNQSIREIIFLSKELNDRFHNRLPLT